MAERFDPEAFHHHPNPLIRRIEQQRVRELVRLARLQPHHRVLEVGCGPGDILLALPTGQRIGLDLSRRLLSRAAQRLGPAVPLLRGDAAALPLATGSCDRVICSEVLEHVPRPDRLLRELARVLRPGGVAVVSIPEEAWIERCKELIWQVNLANWFTRRELSAPEARTDPRPGSARYRMVRHMADAWHLHRFSLALLRELTPAAFYWEQVVSVPSRWLPLRRVVAFRRKRSLL